MKQLISIWILVCTSVTVVAQKNDTRLAGMDTMINRILHEWHVPGVSISVVEKNKVLMTKGFGYRALETKSPVTENTLFAIGSCTKAFTASLFGFAMKEDQLDLDVPVNTYFPELRFYNNELTANITVRDMLTHRTGLPRHDYSWYSGVAGTRDSLVRLVRFLEPSAPLRQSFQYNNYMYAAVGSLLEKMYQKSWEALVAEKLFSPLRMTGSTTGVMNGKNDFAYGYIYKNEKVEKLDFLPGSLQGIAPAGGIISNAKDMANWLLMWTNQGKFDGKEIIPANFYQQAISSQMVVSANLPSHVIPDYFFFNYGLGWYTANYRGHYGVGHGGNINGFSSFVIFLPTDSIGIFVSANQNNSTVPRILTNLIADRLLGAPYRDWNNLLKPSKNGNDTKQDSAVAATSPTHPLSGFSGTYKNEAYGTIAIREEGGVLKGIFNRWKLTIQHRHHNYFRFAIDADVFDGSEAMDGEFTVNARGGIKSLKLPFENDIAEIEFHKQAAVQTDKTALKEYVGDYDFSGMAVKMYLTETGVLKVIVPGQPEYELEFVQKDEFSIKGAKGITIRFERDEKGSVPSCLFIQPNGTMKVKRIGNTGKSEVTESQKGMNGTVNGNEDLTKYAGEYLLGGQKVIVSIKGNSLMALLPGQPEYSLVPVAEHAFSVKGAKGYSVKFDKTESGHITGFTLVQPQGTLTAIKK